MIALSFPVCFFFTSTSVYRSLIYSILLKIFDQFCCIVRVLRVDYDGQIARLIVRKAHILVFLQLGNIEAGISRLDAVFFACRLVKQRGQIQEIVVPAIVVVHGLRTDQHIHALRGDYGCKFHQRVVICAREVFTETVARIDAYLFVLVSCSECFFYVLIDRKTASGVENT